MPVQLAPGIWVPTQADVAQLQQRIEDKLAADMKRAGLSAMGLPAKRPEPRKEG
jgi:hypothetical protein